MNETQSAIIHRLTGRDPVGGGRPTNSVGRQNYVQENQYEFQKKLNSSS